jgi:hypothetical protein
MPYVLDPHVAGELGPGTVLDRSRHPPGVSELEYVLDDADTDDLIESFPVFLVTERLAARLADGTFAGFILEPATVQPGPEPAAAAPGSYRRLVPVEGAAAQPDVWLTDEYRLGVSDRLMEALREFDLRRCDVFRLGDSEPMEP